jgi:hypothetical protein
VKKPKKGPKDQPLRVDIKGGVLSISVGIKTVAWAAENPPDGYEPVQIVDVKEFAEDVRRELLREEDDGTMPVHTLLDKAIEEAINQGSIAVFTPGES